MGCTRLLFVVLTVSASLSFLGASHTSKTPRGTVISAAPMLEPRSGHTATLLPNGKVLIAGGMRRNQDFYKSAELYDPSTGKFVPTGGMSMGRVGHTAVLLLSGKVLIAGGWIGHGCTDSAELYNPTTGKFTSVAAKMTMPRGDARATLLTNGDVLITGGGYSDSPAGIASAEILQVVDMSFHPLQPMHFARVSHTATLLHDGCVLIVGGRGERVNAIAEIYDPKTQGFTETGRLITARYKHIAGLLPDGRVLVAGGSDERDWSGNLSSAEIYNPKTGMFTAAPSLSTARFKLPGEAVVLKSGALLIAGGAKGVDVFDPTAGTFRPAQGEISEAWHFMTETELQDGRVLLAGGYPNNDRATAQTWIYRP
jgi:hypothetical protein